VSISVLVLLGAAIFQDQDLNAADQAPAQRAVPAVDLPPPVPSADPAVWEAPFAAPPFGDPPFSAACPTCPRVFYWESTCNLPPHYAYYPTFHGYFTFQPYNYSSVLRQQQTALCWGLDPRAPYATNFFQKFYLARGITGNELPDNPMPARPSLPGSDPLPKLDDVLRNPAE
jgi:hypothetical protein